MRADHQRLLRGVPQMLAYGVRELPHCRALAHDSLQKERLKPLARARRKVAGTCTTHGACDNESL